MFLNYIVKQSPLFETTNEKLVCIMYRYICTHFQWTFFFFQNTQKIIITALSKMFTWNLIWNIEI